MTDHDAAGAAKEAAAVQAVELAGTLCLVVLGVVFQVAQRSASDPDFVPQMQQRARRWRIRAARAAEGRLARLGIWALGQAELQRRAADGN